MRGLTTRERLLSFMRELGRRATDPADVYLTGGATALLRGWRESTVDIDLKIVPESDDLLRALPELKELLGINLELAAPDHFIPALPGWRERSESVDKQGQVSFFSYDLYSQALAKIERGHVQDQSDLESMLSEGSIDRARLLEFYEAIEPELYKYPAVDPKSFRQAVLRVVEEPW